MLASVGVYGTICRQLQDTNHTNTIVTVITVASTIVCFLAVLRMISFIKISLVGKHPIMKTAALKGLVAFAIILDLVYTILKAADAIHPNSIMNKKDWFVGLPNMVICCAALIFSVLIVVPFSASPYTEKAMPGMKRLSFFRAVWDLINLTDILFAGLSCLPNSFRNWKKKPEGGSEVRYYKDAAAADGGLSVPPPAYSQPQGAEDGLEMFNRPRDVR